MLSESHEADTAKPKKVKNATPAKSGGEERLRSFVDRLLRLEGEKEELNEDIKQVMKDAESEGFDKTALKVVLKLKRKGRDNHLEGVVNTYLESLGELPLFQWVS